MGWKDDGHGKLFKTNEAKLYGPSHTWAMKLSQLNRQSGIVRIITYSLPDLDYTVNLLGKRPNDIFLICHSKFSDKANLLVSALPGIKVAVRNDIHTKILLLEPSTIYITSANFGQSGWHETTMGVRSTEAHAWYVANVFNPLWDSSKTIN